MDDEAWIKQKAHDFERKTAREIIDAIRPETMLDGYSQLSEVAYELAKSICQAAEVGTAPRYQFSEAKAEFIEEQGQRVKDLISGMPSAFHHFSLTNPAGQPIFELRPEKFLQSIANVKDEPIDKLRKAYGVLWIHARALDEVQWGKKSKAHADHYLHPFDEGLANIAFDYLKEPDFESPALEMALIDALIYARILSFSVSCQYFGLLNGLPRGQQIDGPLLAGTSDEPMGAKQGMAKVIGGLLAKFGILAISEMLVLFVTWLIASELAGESKWLLFTGITAARWIVTAIREQKIGTSSERINLELLWDMTLAHDRVPEMNVKLLQHLLFKLEERGAGFNGQIYAILDKRAKREALYRQGV